MRSISLFSARYMAFILFVSTRFLLFVPGANAQSAFAPGVNFIEEVVYEYYGRYSCRRRGERAKLAPPPAEETESDYRREFRKSSWGACIKRIYEVDPLECPKCKAQMRIIAFIQDEHSIKDIMKAQGIPDFQARYSYTLDFRAS